MLEADFIGELAVEIPQSFPVPAEPWFPLLRPGVPPAALQDLLLAIRGGEAGLRQLERLLHLPDPIEPSPQTAEPSATVLSFGRASAPSFPVRASHQTIPTPFPRCDSRRSKPPLVPAGSLARGPFTAVSADRCGYSIGMFLPR